MTESVSLNNFQSLIGLKKFQVNIWLKKEKKKKKELKLLLL